MPRHLEINALVQLTGDLPEKLTGYLSDGAEVDVVLADVPEWRTLRVAAISATSPHVAIDCGDVRIPGVPLALVKLKYG